MPLPKAELDKIEREATGKQDAAGAERILRSLRFLYATPPAE